MLDKATVWSSVIRVKMPAAGLRRRDVAVSLRFTLADLATLFVTSVQLGAAFPRLSCRGATGPPRSFMHSSAHTDFLSPLPKVSSY